MFQSWPESKKTRLLMVVAALVLLSTLGGMWAGIWAFGSEGAWLLFIGILFIVFYALVGVIVLRVYSQRTFDEDAPRVRANIKDIRAQAANSKNRHRE